MAMSPAVPRKKDQQLESPSLGETQQHLATKEVKQGTTLSGAHTVTINHQGFPHQELHSAPPHGCPTVCAVETEREQEDLSTLLERLPVQGGNHSLETLARAQAQDPEVQKFIECGELPEDELIARKMALQQSLFTVIDGVLYYVDPKRNNRKRAVVPQSLKKQILERTHAGPFGGHFSGQRMFNVLVSSWWWEHISSDTTKFARACPECTITTGVGRRVKPPFHPIPVRKPFQILGIDVMDLPLTDSGNRHVVVIRDLFTKWPFVFPVPDQKAPRIARLLAEQVIPWFGVPEALLSDRGANLLAHLILDLCKILGITKLNTSSYHPQCDGAVERFNRTLKQVLRRHAARFGRQWDRYLPGVLWAYRNTPHSATGEKPSFLLFGVDLRSPTEAAYLPLTQSPSTTLEDYREELMVSISSARNLAAEMIQKAQTKYKSYNDQNARKTHIRVGDWVLVRFPHEESGRNRKLSKPWHGPSGYIHGRYQPYLHKGVLSSTWGTQRSPEPSLPLPSRFSRGLLLVRNEEERPRKTSEMGRPTSCNWLCRFGD